MRKKHSVRDANLLIKLVCFKILKKQVVCSRVTYYNRNLHLLGNDNIMEIYKKVLIRIISKWLLLNKYCDRKMI